VLRTALLVGVLISAPAAAGTDLLPPANHVEANDKTCDERVDGPSAT
jgi:hypothetical protein